MSTIASPRRHGTPTSSTRPSLDTSRSAVASPVLPAGQFPKRSRVALREYYNLRAPPRIEVLDSEVASSELDAAGFDVDAYVGRVTTESSIEELLRLYTRVVGEVRALEAEKKALVYDNYSKLIDATETIRKMQANMDPLNPMAASLDTAMAQIHTQAAAIRSSLRTRVDSPDAPQARRRRTRELAAHLVSAPERVRALIREGKTDEARQQWEVARRLLEAWRERGLDVQQCLDAGEAALQEE